ncbi:hypothetical protein NUM3379_23090 [Kineococcus sp. NUM-3379]
MDGTGGTPGQDPGRDAGRVRSRRRVGRAAALTALAVGAVALPVTLDGQEARATGLTPFTDCAALDGWFTRAALPRVGPYGLDGGGHDAFFAGGAMLRTAVAESAAGAAGPGTAVAAPAYSGSTADQAGSALGGAVGPGGTGTNVQEQGVDEPDLVKVAGDLVVTVSGTRLHVARARDGELTALGSVGLPGEVATELLLVDGRAVVVSSAWSAGTAEDGAGEGAAALSSLPWGGPGTTHVTVVDLSDPAAPRVRRTEELEGGYVSARLSGGAVRLVLTSTPLLRFQQPQGTWSPEPGPDPATPAARADEPAAEPTAAPAPGPAPEPVWTPPTRQQEERARAANRAVVEELDGADWLPHRIERGADGKVVRRTPAVACADVAHPGAPAGLGTTTVLTLDARAPELPTRDTTAVTSDSGTVYASGDRLYVATQDWSRGGAEGAARTELHSFDTTDPARTRYVASGAVQGTVLGRWALDEQDGRLRVATTVTEAPGISPATPLREEVEPRPAEPGAGEQGAGDEGTGEPLPVDPGIGGPVPGDPVPVDPGIGGPPAPPRSESFVTVLAEEGDRLVARGSVGGLGPGESIRSVRWFDDTALVVTFRQTDPLYAVDLSDPERPRVAGELKVNGYSGYLHPVGGDVVLGVGMDGTDEGELTTPQVSAFDLRDPSAPRRLDAVALPGWGSDVEGDSRAFSYLPRHRLALVPVQGEAGSTVVAVRVEESGQVGLAGEFRAGTERWVRRAVPVGDGVVVVAEGPGGTSLTLLGLPGLERRAAVDLR